MGSPLVFTPRLMREPSAAAYIGVSPSYLRTLDIPRKQMADRMFAYEKADLDAWADALPYEGQSRGSTCKGAFGKAAS